MKKRYQTKVGHLVSERAFAVEQHPGTWRVHHWPPGPIEEGVSTREIVRRARSGERVVCLLLHPRGAVADIVRTRTGVRWKVRPSACDPEATSPSASAPS